MISKKCGRLNGHRGQQSIAKRKVDVEEVEKEQHGENEWKWLQFDGDFNLMFCKICIAYDESGKGRSKYPIKFLKLKGSLNDLNKKLNKLVRNIFKQLFLF